MKFLTYFICALLLFVIVGLFTPVIIFWIKLFYLLVLQKEVL